MVRGARSGPARMARCAARGAAGARPAQARQCARPKPRYPTSARYDRSDRTRYWLQIVQSPEWRNINVITAAPIELVPHNRVSDITIAWRYPAAYNKQPVR